MKAVVTGGAGFIGSHLVDRLVAAGDEVVVIDNLSSGANLVAGHVKGKLIDFVKCDVREMGSIEQARGAGVVFHLAAVSDIRSGLERRRHMFEQNVAATMELLECMRSCGIGTIVLFSTQAVYGNVHGPITEETPPAPVSLYGATKLMAEQLCALSAQEHGIQARLLRLANVVGERQTHGVIVDFIGKLRKNPDELEILGDGKQEKSYVHINDCIDGVLCAMEKAHEPVSRFNIGSADTITVDEIAAIVAAEMRVRPVVRYTGGEAGWPGDIPVSRLSSSRLQGLGWSPRYSSGEAVKEAARSLLA